MTKVLFREFVVSGYRLIAVENGGQVIAASIWGKIKTATQMVAIIMMFIDKYAFADFLNTTIRITMSSFDFVFNIIASTLMFVSVIAAIFSGWNYIKGGKDLFKDR